MISLVQFVAGVALIFAPCPQYHAARYACYVPSTRTIYAPLRHGHPSELEEAHEYGHAFDFDHPELRPLWRRVMGYRADRRWWQARYRSADRGDSEAPGEQFAENYAACALGYRWPNYDRFCALLPASAYGMIHARLEP